MLRKFLNWWVPNPDIEYFVERGPNLIETIPKDIFLLIACFLDVKEIMKLVTLNKNFKNGITPILISGKVLLNEVSVIGNTYDDVNKRLYEANIRNIKARLDLEKIKIERAQITHWPPDFAPLSCCFAMLCFLVSSSTGSIGLYLFYSNNEVVNKIGLGLLVKATAAGTLGVISYTLCKLSIFAQKTDADLNNEAYSKEKNINESTIKIKQS